MVKPLPNAPFPFNDDEIKADPERYRAFLLNGMVGREQRQRERDNKKTRRTNHGSR